MIKILAEIKQENSILEVALDYGKRGWHVFPATWPKGDGRCSCNKPSCDAVGKHAIERGWQEKASENPEKIKAMFSIYPQANIGIATGKRSGFFVLDVDIKEDGPGRLRELEAECGQLPDTIEAITGSGGRHILFKYPQRIKIKNAVRFDRGLDIRSDGGLIIAAPSIHLSGWNYEWNAEFHPDEVELADAPEWLLMLMSGGVDSENKQIRKRFELPATIRDGERNNTIFKMASSLRAKGFYEDEILAMIEMANKKRCNPPLQLSELEKIAVSVAKFEPGEEFNNDPEGFEWQETEELLETVLKPVSPLQPEMIPEPFRPWLTDISVRMQCPLDFLGAAAVVVSSAVIGAGCGVRPKSRDDWLVISNLWGGAIARPSMLKSPSLAEVMKPLGRLEAEAKEQYEEELKYYEADIEIYKAEKEALKSSMQAVAKNKTNGPNVSMLELKGQLIELEPPAAPIRKRYRTNDSTIEKLGELLNENQRGILTFRDELIGLLTSWDREDRRQDRAFYLEAWNGSGSFTTDRVGRGTIDIPNCCVSILGGIQPSKLLGYLQQAINDISNDGMIQRFQLLVYPDEPQHWKLVDQWPDKAAKDTAWQIIKTLAEMDFLKAGADLMDDEVIPFFRFSSGGQAVFNEWLTELEAKIRQDDFPLMIEHLAKFRSLMPSLALIFHVVDIAGGKPPGPITEEAALMAAEWCEYLESHARRIYSIAGDVSVKAAIELTMKIKTGKIKDGFSLRDIYRNCWHLLDTKGKVEAACRELIETGWLHSESVEVSSRGSKEIFRVNPKIFTQKH